MWDDCNTVTGEGLLSCNRDDGDIPFQQSTRVGMIIRPTYVDNFLGVATITPNKKYTQLHAIMSGMSSEVSAGLEC